MDIFTRPDDDEVKSEEVRKVTSEKSGDKHQDGVSDDESNLLD